jgi:hypothetical protein
MSPNSCLARIPELEGGDDAALPGASSDRRGTMDIFELPPHLVILQTEHWMLNHRVDSALPGDLMPGARMATNDLWRMPPQIPRATRQSRHFDRGLAPLVYPDQRTSSDRPGTYASCHKLKYLAARVAVDCYCPQYRFRNRSSMPATPFGSSRATR